MHFDFTPKFCVHIVIAVTMLMALLRQITPYAIPNFATLPKISYSAACYLGIVGVTAITKNNRIGNQI